MFNISQDLDPNFPEFFYFPRLPFLVGRCSLLLVCLRRQIFFFLCFPFQGRLPSKACKTFFFYCVQGLIITYVVYELIFIIQHHISKASILLMSSFLIVQHSLTSSAVLHISALTNFFLVSMFTFPSVFFDIRRI